MKAEVIFTVAVVLHNVDKKTMQRMQAETDQMGSGLDLSVSAVSYYPFDNETEDDGENEEIEFDEMPLTGKTKKPVFYVDWTQVKSITKVKK